MLNPNEFYVVDTPGRTFLGSFDRAEGSILKFKETMTVGKSKYHDFLESGNLNIGQKNKNQRRFVCDYIFPVHLLSSAIPVVMPKKPPLSAVKEGSAQSVNPETTPVTKPVTVETLSRPLSEADQPVADPPQTDSDHLGTPV